MDWTGAPIILFRLLADLAKRHDVTVVRPRDSIDGGPLAALYEQAAIDVVDRTTLGQFDVFLGNTIMTSHLAKRASRQCPVLWWIHEPKAGLGMIQRERVDLSAFQSVDLVCVSTAWQRDVVYREWVRDAETIMIPYGIEPITCKDGRPEVFDPAGFHLVLPGYLGYRKGQAVALDALVRLRREGLHLHLIGSTAVEGNQASDILRRIDHDAFLNAHVHVYGSIPQEKVAVFLAHADAFVFPTNDDLITISILEAMSQGLCVISSDFGPIPETVINGDTGLLFPVGDAETLATRIAFAIDNPEERRRIAKRGHEIVRHKHGFREHVQGMEAALERAIEARRIRGRPLSG